MATKNKIFPQEKVKNESPYPPRRGDRGEVRQVGFTLIYVSARSFIKKL
jgi:hypothetical protein